jgi:hypothetical protein
MKRALLALCLLIGPISAADYSSCRSALDDLRQRSDDAATKAREVADAEEDLEECRSSQPISECRSKLNDYESEKDSLDSALEDVASKVRDVSSSCGIDLSQAASLEHAKARFCKALNRGRMYYMPTAVLLDQCKKSMTEEECRKCLDIK